MKPGRYVYMLKLTVKDRKTGLTSTEQHGFVESATKLKHTSSLWAKTGREQLKKLAAAKPH